MGTVYKVNGRATADFRYLRRLYRERRYRLEGTQVVLTGDEGVLRYEVWDLVFTALFLQRKAVLLCCLFCLYDIDADMRRLNRAVRNDDGSDPHTCSLTIVNRNTGLSDMHPVKI